MESSGYNSSHNDPFRIRDRIYLTLDIADADLRWHNKQDVRFKCLHAGLRPSNDIDIYLSGIEQPVARIRHNLLARYIHTGTRIQAQTINRTRRRFLRRRQPESQTLEICVQPGELDWKKINPIIERNNDIALKIEEAGYYAMHDQRKALALYEDAVKDIFDLHFESPLAEYWRRVQFPVNELSELLENMGAPEAAYNTIASYEAFDDQLGLLAVDGLAVRERKTRLIRKMAERRDDTPAERMTRQRTLPELEQRLQQRVAG